MGEDYHGHQLGTTEDLGYVQIAHSPDSGAGLVKGGFCQPVAKT